MFKTAHHIRFEFDYRQTAVDVALATAAAPTYFAYKLFELLSAHSKSALSVGELKVGLKRQHMRLKLLLENKWREKLPQSLG